MQQDLNPSPCLSLGIFLACEGQDKEAYFLEQG